MAYDFIVVICGWALTEKVIIRLKNSLLKNNGKMILYYWDSFDTLKDDPKRRQYFDSVYSFDNVDCMNNPATVNFLPLFFCKEYRKKL